MKKKLTLGTDSKSVVGGVCAGIADYLAVDVTFIRIAALCLLFLGYGLILYLIFYIAMPHRR
jgi:phage shock protein C